MQIPNSFKDYQDMNTIEIVLCKFFSPKIWKVISMFYTLVCLGACTVMKTDENFLTSPALSNKVFVYDTQRRRVIIRFYQDSCTVQQYNKLINDTIKMVGTYKWIPQNDPVYIGKAILMLKNRESLELKSPFLMPRIGIKMYIKPFSYLRWHYDRGADLCLEELTLTKNSSSSVMYFECQKKYISTNPRDYGSVGLYQYLCVDEKALKKHKIKFKGRYFRKNNLLNYLFAP